MNAHKHSSSSLPFPACPYAIFEHHTRTPSFLFFSYCTTALLPFFFFCLALLSPLFYFFFHLSLTVVVVLVIVVCPILSRPSLCYEQDRVFFLSSSLLSFFVRLLTCYVCLYICLLELWPMALSLQRFVLLFLGVAASSYCCHCCMGRMG